jgi:hypothetical protein
MRNIIILLAAVVVVAAGSAYVTRVGMEHGCMCPARAESSYATLNRQLALTAPQKEVILKLEEAFETKENALRKSLDAANRSLAATIASEGEYSPKVAAAVEHVHMCMGELQKASIAHLYEINRQLDPQQRQKLMSYVGLALGNCDLHP